MSREIRKTMPRRPVRRGPGGLGPGAPAEKPKEFKKTLGKTLRYMRKNILAMAIAFVLAIGGVIATLLVPDIMGQATDELMTGVLRAQIYKTVKLADSMVTDEMSEAAKSDPGQTLVEWLSAHPQDIPQGDVQLTDEAMQDMAHITIGQMVRAHKQDTLGAYMRELGMAEVFDALPDEYASAVFGTSLLGEEPGVDVQKVVHTLVLTLILVCVSGVLSYLQGFILATVAQSVSYRFRKDIYAKIDKLPLKYFDGTTHGEVMSYLTNDVDMISTSLNQSLSQLLTAATTLIGVMVMMFRINWILTLVALVIIPVSLLIVLLVVKKSQKYYLRQQEYLGHVNGQIEEVFGGQNVVKLFSGEERAKQEFAGFNVKLYESAWKSQFYSGTMMPANKLMGNISFVLTCVLGGYFVINGSMLVGQIQAFASYVRQFNQPISQVSGIANTLQSTVAASERVFNFLEQPEEEETGEKDLGEVAGDVTFENVRFGYDPEKIIIKNFNCEVKAGQTIAIVGPTGAGKTTIVKLLMRFYELNGGAISVDGIPASSVTRASLRREVGMVLQDTWLFSGTIRDNIRYGKLDATDEEVIAAAKCAYADHFINTLPGGYDFVINEEGANISQGQKQLLTIARAVLADPRILILDEATSSVDTRTEQLIQQAMDRLMQGRTSFVIAHRLSTIKNADRILVLMDGDVVEQGTHEELLAAGGAYAELYLQLAIRRLSRRELARKRQERSGAEKRPKFFTGFEGIRLTASAKRVSVQPVADRETRRKTGV